MGIWRRISNFIYCIHNMVLKFNSLYRGRDIELSIPMTAKVLVRYVFAEEYLFDQTENNIFTEVAKLAGSANGSAFFWSTKQKFKNRLRTLSDPLESIQIAST